MCFLSTTFPNAPVQPPPPPLSFLTKSLNTDTEIIYFVQLLNKLRHRIRAAFET